MRCDLLLAMAPAEFLQGLLVGLFLVAAKAVDPSSVPVGDREQIRPASSKEILKRSHQIKQSNRHTGGLCSPAAYHGHEPRQS